MKKIKINGKEKVQRRLRVLSVFVAMFFVLMTSFSTKPVKAATGYNRSKAIEYAKSHWNDGKGLCAQFVSECIKAGGSSCYSAGASTLRRQLLASGTGHEVVLSYENQSVRYVEGVTSPGDVLFFKCGSCSDGNPYVHVVLIAGKDSNGYIKAFSHNNANSGASRYYYSKRCPYCNGEIVSASVYHFDDTEDKHEIAEGVYTISSALDPKYKVTVMNDFTVGVWD